MSQEIHAISNTVQHSTAHGIMGLMMIIGFIVLYNLPWIIALKRKLPNTLAIFLLDFFLGWSFVGWVVALVWACAHTEERSPINITLNNKGDIK